MKKIFTLLLFVTICLMQGYAQDYLVLAGQSLKGDAQWEAVVTALSQKHNNAPVVYYKENPDELLKDVQKANPRFVGIVEKPDNLGQDYIMRLNRFSRTIDNDIYADFFWGVITGYDAAGALNMVNNTTEPMVLRSCVSTIMETETGKWFEKYAYMDDQNMGIYGYKWPWDETTRREAIQKTVPATRGTKQVPDLLPLFYEMYKTIDPDLIITASHASQKALEMPFSAGFIKSKDGVLYAQLPEGNKDLVQSGKRRVYLPIGNCLIGDINNTNTSMAIAWMNSANVATFVGYVVSTWHGRSGWGCLKYFLTTPGRYTVNEAFFLNQQDMLFQMNAWYPQLNGVPYDFTKNNKDVGTYLESIIKTPVNKDHIGFWYDRDVLAFYGDPAWNVRLADKPEERDFTVTGERKGKQYILTIKTGLNYSPRLISGDHFKEVHVLDIPFSYIFPERLNNPRLAEGQRLKVALDENFILIYGNRMGPNNTYEIVLDID